MESVQLRPVWGAHVSIFVFVALLASGCGGGDSGSTTNAQLRAGTLFVQSAEGGGFEKAGKDATTLVLRLVSSTTTTFTDRPERKSGAIPTPEFAKSFKGLVGGDPPNAAVSTVKGGGEFTVELSNPRYNAATRTLTYTARPIGSDGSDLPRRFGPVSLFIDAFPTAVNGGGPPPTNMAGRVMDKCGNVVQDAQIQVMARGDSPSGQEGHLGTGTTSLSGNYEIDNIDDDSVTVWIAAQYFDTLSQDVDLTIGETNQRTFTMTLVSEDCSGGAGGP